MSRCKEAASPTTAQVVEEATCLKEPPEEEMKVVVVVHAQINSLTLVLAHSRPVQQTFSTFSTYGEARQKLHFDLGPEYTEYLEKNSET